MLVTMAEGTTYSTHHHHHYRHHVVSEGVDVWVGNRHLKQTSWPRPVTVNGQHISSSTQANSSPCIICSLRKSKIIYICDKKTTLQRNVLYICLDICNKLCYTTWICLFVNLCSTSPIWGDLVNWFFARTAVMKLDLYRSCGTSGGSPLRIMLLCCVGSSCHPVK